MGGETLIWFPLSLVIGIGVLYAAGRLEEEIKRRRGKDHAAAPETLTEEEAGAEIQGRKRQRQRTQ